MNYFVSIVLMVSLSFLFVMRMIVDSVCTAEWSLFVKGVRVLSQDLASNFFLIKSFAKIKAGICSYLHLKIPEQN